MSKLKLPILLVMLSLSIVICSAKCILTSQTEHVPITMIAGAQHGGNDKSSSMYASINGHTLTLAFTENLGTVLIEIQDETGASLDLSLLGTPTGYQCYIPLAGRYTLLIKLDDDEVYSGEFEVED